MKKTKEKPKEKGPEKEVKEALPVPVEETAPLVPVNYRSKLTRAQIELIKTTIAKGASDDELKMFLYVCERTKLDPFTKQVHLVPRWDSKTGREVRSVIVGIDGLRSVAERTGLYAGNSDPTFEGQVEVKDGEKKSFVPEKAVSVVKKMVQGTICDFTASAKWVEYYPGDKQGFMWRRMPETMLGKCAEAKALRKAFPQVMSGLYVAEEMHQAQGEEKKQIDSPFETAKRMILQVKDAEGLREFKRNVQRSKKYTDVQKKELAGAVDARIGEIEKDAIPIIEEK